MQTKSIFESKTAIVNTVVILTAFYPPVGSFVAANPELSLTVLGLANVLLRLVTKKKIQLFPG